MYVCTVYTYLCAHAFMDVCIHVRMYVFIYVGMHVCICVRMHVYMYVHIYVSIYVFIHICVCVCIHYVCKQPRTYTYTHHIRNVSPPQHTAHMSPPRRPRGTSRRRSRVTESRDHPSSGGSHVTLG